MSRPLRGTQAISPFGIGSIIVFPGPESLIHAGLDAWQEAVSDGHGGIKRELRIDNEPALAKRLGVDFFVTPPFAASGVKLPFLRFPRFHSCPSCGRLADYPLSQKAVPRCGGYGGKRHRESPMQQVRFVAACRSGHLRDFPWIEWLAGAPGNGLTVDEMRRIYLNGGWLRLENTGLTGGQGTKIILGHPDQEVVASRTLAGAFGGDPSGLEGTPLSRLGIKCRSENPVTGIVAGHQDCRDCESPLIVLLRGSGNLHFADIESAIYVPDSVPGDLAEEARDLFENDMLVGFLLREAERSRDGKLSVRDAAVQLRDRARHVSLDSSQIGKFVEVFNQVEPFRQLTTHPDLSERIRQLGMIENPLSDESILSVMRKISINGDNLDRWECVPEGLAPKLQAWVDGTRSDGEENVRNDPSSVAKRHEFDVFSLKEFQAKTLPKSILKLRSYPIENYGGVIKKHFEHIGLVDSLRETRVFKGFSRIYATQKHPEQYRNLLARNRMNWLPAAMVFGEGVFFRFSMPLLTEWERIHGAVHDSRLANINTSLKEIAERRQAEYKPVTARFAMVHTFAHALINQMVFDSGYGTSSLRERIYVSESRGDNPGMAGMLIYTAAGDSEGSMGGLVRLGEPGILEGIVSRALESSLWCSSDPVCIESKGQGPDSCNLAACHSCGLLPETSCDHGNTMLDRGTIVGTLSGPGIGYFSRFCRTA